MAETLASRLAQVRAAVERAARSAGRDPAAVTIVAVTKTRPPADVAAILAAGLADVGESYVQEARAKHEAVAHLRRNAGRWHLVGGLQRNKVRAAVGVFDLVQSVDSSALAAELAAEAGRAGRRLPVLVQVNASGEPSKRGTPPEAAEALIAEILRHPTLAVEGLMTIAAPGDDPEQARPAFRTLREVRNHAAGRLGVELPHLSMGMSDDFTIAVEEGATWLRLGRVLFGARGPSAWRSGSSARGEGS